jgi:hypothetical protein
MAAKRYLAEPSNDQIRKKNKVDGTTTIEKLKVIMLNGSSTKSNTVILGTKEFDATLLGSMGDILLRGLPAYDFIKEDGEEGCAVYSINFKNSFSEEEMSLLVTKLDLNGAAAVFYGDKDVRHLGLILWCIAAKLRHKNPQAAVEQTVLEKRVSNGKTEAASFGDLRALLRQRRKHWITQGILKTQRVCKQNKLDPNHFIFDSYYKSLLQGWEKRNSTEDAVFFQVLYMMELAEIHLLKRRPIIQIVDPILKVLSELQKVLKAPSVNFEKLMSCLSFATRLNLETLAIGEKEGVALEHIHGILKRIVQMPNRDQSRLTTLMEKYLEKYKKLLPPCAPSHYGFIGLNNLYFEPSFEKENWIVPLKTFLSLKKPGVRPLLCVMASNTTALYVEEDLKEIPYVGIDNLLTYH